MDRLLHSVSALFISAIVVVGILLIILLVTSIFSYLVTRPDQNHPDFNTNEAYLQ